MIALFALAPTAAASDQYFELQVDPLWFLQLYSAHGSRSGKDCPEVVESDGFGPSIVNHVEWPTDTTTQPILLEGGDPFTAALSVGDVTYAPPIARLPLRLQLRTLDCVYDPDCHPFDTHAETVWLDFALTSGPDGICADFVGTSELPSGTEDAVIDQIERFGRPCFDPSAAFQPLLDVLYDWRSFEDVGLAADAESGAVAIRASVEDPLHAEAQGDWLAFLEYELFAEPWIGNEQWIIDEALLRRALADRLYDAVSCGWDLSAPACTDGVEPGLPATTTWDPDAAAVTVALPVSGGSLCAAGGAIEATTTFTMALDPPGPGGGGFYLDEAAYTLGMVTELSGGIGCDGAWEAVRTEWDAAFSGLEDGGCTRSGGTVTCAGLFPVLRFHTNGPASGWYAPVQPQGVFGGLSFGGTWAYDASGGIGDRLELDGTHATYDIRHEECSAHAGYEGLLEMINGPGELCDAADLGLPTPLVLNDVLGVYDFGFGTVVEDRTYTLAPTPDFWDAPYGPLVTVWSTAGAATIQLYPPLEGDEPDGIDWRLLLARLEAYLGCHPLYEGPPIPGWFDLQWLVDPPPYRVVVTGTGWTDATATLRRAQIVQSAPVYDRTLGVTTIAAGTAVLSTTWAVSDPLAGAFEFTVASRIPTMLGGTEQAVVPTATSELAIAVPSTSLPRGVRSMAFTMPLPAADVVFTATPGR